MWRSSMEIETGQLDVLEGVGNYGKSRKMKRSLMM